MSASTPNPLWAMIQRYMDHPKHRYPPRPADIARECGISQQLLSKWKAKPTLPSPDQLWRLSRGTGIMYPRLLEAALQGKGYFVAGPSRVVTVDFLEDQDAQDMQFDEEFMPFMRPVIAAADDEAPLETEQEQTEEST